MRELRLSFSTLACPDWSWDDVVRNGPEAGYQGVEVRLIEREVNLLARPEFQSDQLLLRRRGIHQPSTGVAALGMRSSTS